MSANEKLKSDSQHETDFVYRCEVEQCGMEKRSRQRLAIYGTCKECGVGAMRRVLSEDERRENGEQIIACNVCGESAFLSKAWRTAQAQMSKFRKDHVCTCPAHGDVLKRGQCATCEAMRSLGVDENDIEPDPMNNGDW